MTGRHTLVHVEDVRPENMKPGEGWAISEFRLPISGRDGSATTIFHSIFRPGSTHARHLHSKCDEIAVYLKGHGIVGQSDERTEVRPGHCRLMPSGSEHFFHNETRDEDGLVIGFYMGAAGVPETGYEFRGAVTREDLERPRRAGLEQGILVNVEHVKPMALPRGKGWAVSDFRLPIGRHNGSPNALFWARLAPGDVHHRHRFDNCEVLYYVIRGDGIVGAGDEVARVRGGHVHHLARGVEHFMANASANDTLEVIGVWTGAGSLEEAGYVHLGEVASADLARAQAHPSQAPA